MRRRQPSVAGDSPGMLPINPPIMARIGFSRWAVGSTSTPNAANAVAPSRYREPDGAKMIGQVSDPSRPSMVSRASPSRRRSRRRNQQPRMQCHGTHVLRLLDLDDALRPRLSVPNRNR